MTTDDLSPPGPGLPIERFGVLRGRIAKGEALEAVLGDAGLTPAQWEQEVIAWSAALGEDLERGEEARLRRYLAAVKRVETPATPLAVATAPAAWTPSVATKQPRATVMLPASVEVSSHTAQVDMRAVRATLAGDATPFAAKQAKRVGGDDDTEKHDMRLVREALAAPAASGTDQVDMRAVRAALARGATPFEAAKLAVQKVARPTDPPPELDAPVTRRRGR